MKNVYVKIYVRKFLNGCLTWETYRNFERILTELRSEKFEWFGPSPIEPFNLVADCSPHDVPGRLHAILEGHAPSARA